MTRYSCKDLEHDITFYVWAFIYILGWLSTFGAMSIHVEHTISGRTLDIEGWG